MEAPPFVTLVFINIEPLVLSHVFVFFTVEMQFIYIKI